MRANIDKLSEKAIMCYLITDHKIPNYFQRQINFNSKYLSKIANDDAYKNLILKHSYELPYKEKIRQDIQNRKIKIYNSEATPNAAILHKKINLLPIEKFTIKKDNKKEEKSPIEVPNILKYKSHLNLVKTDKITKMNLMNNIKHKDVFDEELENEYEPISFSNEQIPNEQSGSKNHSKAVQLLKFNNFPFVKNQSLNVKKSIEDKYNFHEIYHTQVNHKEKLNRLKDSAKSRIIKKYYEVIDKVKDKHDIIKAENIRKLKRKRKQNAKNGK